MALPSGRTVPLHPVESYLAFPVLPVLRDPDSNPFSLLEGEGEAGGDTDASESMGGAGDRRRRSRRRRNDQEPSVMDAAAESDSQAGTSENGLGESLPHYGRAGRQYQWSYRPLSFSPLR